MIEIGQTAFDTTAIDDDGDGAVGGRKPSLATPNTIIVVHPNYVPS